MALNIYHEARGESIAGQQAVALVTWNRAGRKKAKVCEVVTEPRQFSWTTGKLERVGKGWRLKKGAIPRENEAWKSAVFTARLVMRRKLHDFTGGSTHYHASYVLPKWSHSMVMTRQLGRHLFYRIA